MQKPCKHKKYQTLQARLDSFVGWPGRYVPKTPEELSTAGFFYIGSADRVTCFQCGITLRDWEEEHDPVTEHRRYSETCEFINSKTPHDLGVSTRPVTSKEVEKSEPAARVQNNNEVENMMNGLHLSDEACATAPSHASHISNNDSKTSTDGRVLDNETGNQEVQAGNVSRVAFLRRENIRLKQETLCRVCGQHKANSLFLPCGHLLTCTQCGENTEQCILCGKVILGTVKTYRI